MSGDYTPRAGTLTAKVLENLATLDPGARLTVAEIAGLFAASESSVPTCLRIAVNHGLLVCERVGRTNAYSLPPEPESTDGPLALCHYSTGELSFSGCVVNDDGTVMLNTTQLQQLLDYVTKPRVVPGAAAP